MSALDRLIGRAVFANIEVLVLVAYIIHIGVESFDHRIMKLCFRSRLGRRFDQNSVVIIIVIFVVAAAARRTDAQKVANRVDTGQKEFDACFAAKTLHRYVGLDLFGEKDLFKAQKIVHVEKRRFAAVVIVDSIILQIAQLFAQTLIVGRIFAFECR